MSSIESGDGNRDYGCNEFVSTVAARNDIAEIVNRVAYGKEWIALTRRGKPLVAVIPIEDAGWIEDLQDEYDRQELERVKNETKDEDWTDLEDVAAELVLGSKTSISAK